MEPDDDKTQSHSVLTKGTMVSHYRIVGKIGAGGMGEVYLADDTKLNRKVALKFLLPYLCQDEEGRARFKREAQAAASLNHPNIVTVHEVSEHDGRPYIAMEYLEGQSLRGLLSETTMTLERAVNLISQACDGLAAAHQAGIVHRDIKPSNVHVAPGDAVKILDFGLAASECFEQITRTGSTLGTVDYMSPEQARGDEIDIRSDLFSVGVMLYESITGNKPFRRNNQIATLQAIVNDEPEPLARYKTAVPAELQRVVSKLLSKKPAERYQHADDVAVDLRALDVEAKTSSMVTTPYQPEVAGRTGRRTKIVIPWSIAAVALVILGWQILKPPTIAPQRSISLPVAVPAEYALSRTTPCQVAVSPSGDRWVSRVLDSTSVGHALLWDVDNPKPRILPGTENGGGFFFSPDGNWLGFSAGGMLRKLHLSGGEPADIGQGVRLGAQWTESDTIYYCRDLCSGIWKIPADGGEPEQITKVNEDEFAHWSPEVLPGGQALLFTVWRTSIRDISTNILDFVSGECRILIQGGAHARWVPSGHLVYIRRGTLMAVPFDREALQITGSEVPIIPRIQQEIDDGLGSYSFSRNGFFVYLSGDPDQNTLEFVWVEQDGKIVPLPHPKGQYGSLSISADDKYLVYDKTKDGIDNIWLMEIATCRSSQLTFGNGNFGAVWHPSGSKIAFSTYRNGPFSVYEMPVDRNTPEQPVIIRDIDITAQAHTPDGKHLVISISGDDGSGDLYSLSPEDSSRIYPIAIDAYDQGSPDVHPEGEWIAYRSRESGLSEVYVKSLSGGGSVVQVSVNGGSSPLWSGDGKTLYYWRSDRLMAVAVQTEPQLQVGTPEELFEIPYISSYDVTSDGRFIMIQADPTSMPQLIAVTNWFEEIKRLTESSR